MTNTGNTAGMPNEVLHAPPPGFVYVSQEVTTSAVGQGVQAHGDEQDQHRGFHRDQAVSNRFDPDCWHVLTGAGGGADDSQRRGRRRRRSPHSGPPPPRGAHADAAGAAISRGGTSQSHRAVCPYDQ
jgi:hypothetical protein